ncbi:uncharacterized protein BP5553_00457 [Venustampulla echinocandica]|uniref:Calcineurin-like phosphoesterase domain-containing protein n=1 Tax=Venustampulla echinocandica TaxID=2656787 RepID=A0A370TY96_9HELO|nr:uncharacterized protein BP5553_00457 [Venustampulla echinocandica]RDL40478.1 hypothetical protein BP5553_00457 [Venustampulla echinocandica]
MTSASIFHPQFQVVSDLHLETPLVQPSYSTFKLNLEASYLCLLGDIGLAKDDGLYVFLESLLKRTPNLTILYLLGNHEAYQMTLEAAEEKMRTFAKTVARTYGNRFIFLNRTRYDVNPTITILGCTLWSHILPSQMAEVEARLTDFNQVRGIREWGLEEHLKEHQQDVAWLNSEVEKMHNEEPERQIIVFTHHSPTIDPRANNPIHTNSTVRSGFVTDLSSELCWKSAQVKLWAFGHTHYSFSYREEGTNKLVMANQKGYIGLGEKPESSNNGSKVIEAAGDTWGILPTRSYTV